MSIILNGTTGVTAPGVTGMTTPLTVGQGGTGATTFTAGGILVGNGTSAVAVSAAGTSGQVLVSGGAGVATWGDMSGAYTYTGPTSMGTGSTRTHEGTVTISTNQNLSGIHYYTNFTLNAGVTITVPAGGGRYIIMANGTVTINGTISANGAGGSGGSGGSVAPYMGYGSAGSPGYGTDQPGGAGGGATGAGSYVLLNGIVIASQGTQLTGSTMLQGPTSVFNVFGGAGGGGGGNSSSVYTGPGSGGNGGGSIVIIAPTVVLASGSRLATIGNSGGYTAQSGIGGGGGGAGNIYIVTHSFTDNGAIYTQTGGASGGGGGGAGQNGIRQVWIFP